MFSNVRRCVIVSVRIHRKFLMRSIHEDILPEHHFSNVNARCSNNAIYKRFYCHSTIDEQNVTSADLKNHKQKLDKQKLDEFLSDPENKKRFKILELEVDVLRHNAERVPNNIEPKDWLMLLDLKTKAKKQSVFYLLFIFFFIKNMFDF